MNAYQQQARDIQGMRRELANMITELAIYLDNADSQFGREENEAYQSAIQLINRIK